MGLPDGFRISIPPGALRQSTVITVERIDDAPSFAAGPIYQLGPEGQTFDAPVSITLPVELDSEPMPEGASPWVGAYTAPAGSTDYAMLEVGELLDGSVTAKTNHFSIFFSGYLVAETLAQGEDYPAAVALDDNFIYWTSGGSATNVMPTGNDGVVMRRALSGGSAKALTGPQPGPSGIAISATHIYWANGGTKAAYPGGPTGGAIMRMDKATGAIQKVADAFYPLAMAIDATSAYWSDGDLNTIQKAPLAGGTVSTIATMQPRVEYLILDDSNVYWTSREGGIVASAPKTGEKVRVLASGQLKPEGLAQAGSTVYWVNAGDGWARSVGKSGGSVMNLRQFTKPFDIAVHGDRLIVADPGSSALYMMTLAGQKLNRIVRNQQLPWHVLVNSGTVYWSAAGHYDLTGKVMRAQLP